MIYVQYSQVNIDNRSQLFQQCTS